MESLSGSALALLHTNAGWANVTNVVQSANGLRTPMPESGQMIGALHELAA
jgi:hypothetical protein